MISNRSCPASTIIPVLGYSDVPGAVAWLRQAFGLTERLRIGTHRVQMRWGDGDIVVTDSPPPENPAHAGHSIMLRVEDVDAAFERALTAGATSLRSPTTYPFGERQCSVRDFAGYVWTLSQSMVDVDPAEWGGEMVAP
ncbi:MAG: VOC family protein [Proteobacteria bacterium]|nr:VOC family protein [Pseudomonadota bacterium]